MGRPKAALCLEADAGSTVRPSLASRTARLLGAATRPAAEVGPGYTHLPVLAEPIPPAGPLSAMAAGVEGLRRLGWCGAVVVVATDYPRLPLTILEWLAGHQDPRSVLPVFDGRAQTLCARYVASDQDRAVELHLAGRSAMRDLVASIEPLLVPPEDWIPIAGDAEALRDVDTPADLRRMGLTAYP
jgi:molybdopterin-guanine dinucleotide biosynthesis protein A